MNPHRGLIHHQIIRVSDAKKSEPFYTAIFEYLGYELAGSDLESDYTYQDWKRWDLDTPHEISICSVEQKFSSVEHRRGAVGHHDHIAFCAASREDVDRFYHEVLRPLEATGHCSVEDPPCHCPEYGEGYYATFFYDPDGLKYEFVINPNHLYKKACRESSSESHEIKEFWSVYQMTLPQDHPHRKMACPNAWSFGFEEKLANELVELVMNGAKTATCSRYHGENLLDESGLNIITNGDGTPLCVIDTYEITVIPFNKVSSQFAADEGEGDLSLKYWRKGHWEYFTKESKLEGYEVSEAMLLACKRFRLIYKDRDQNL